MSPRLVARQNKTRLLAVFLFSAIMALCFQLYRGSFERNITAQAQGHNKLNDSMFVGLRRANPAEVRQVLPEAAGKATLLVFSSRFCHDCQRMAPVLSALTEKHPQVYYRKLDVTEDQQKYPAILRTFKPVSVPLMVFIAPNGEIKNVLYNYQKPEVLAAALQNLQTPSAKPLNKVTQQ